MDYLEYFGLSSEPFSHAPAPRFYYGSRQHTSALERLSHTASAMKGLALLVGDIGHGKTTLARRMLDTLPESTFEAALLVMVHAGVTASWLLKRIAIQLGVKEPAEDKVAILGQLYERLVEVHDQGKKAVVLIDEAQMLNTREIMEEFRGLLNLEVPGQKLISFVFFGLPELESNLALDPPLAQRVTMRYHLKPLADEDTARYVEHRLRLAGCPDKIFDSAALHEIHHWSSGVPRVINTICDNVLLELFFARERQAGAEKVFEVAENLGLTRPVDPPQEAGPSTDQPAVEGGPGSDAIAVVGREDDSSDPELASTGPISPDTIAAQIAAEPMDGQDIADPLAFMDANSGTGATPTASAPESVVSDEVTDVDMSVAEVAAEVHGEDPVAPVLDAVEVEVEVDENAADGPTPAWDLPEYQPSAASEEVDLNDAVVGEGVPGAMDVEADVEVDVEVDVDVDVDIDMDDAVEVDELPEGELPEGELPEVDVPAPTEVVLSDGSEVEVAIEEPGELAVPAATGPVDAVRGAPMPPPAPTGAPSPPPAPAPEEDPVVEMQEAAPEVASAEPEAPKPPPSREIKTSSGKKIDLNEIDDLLADIEGLTSR